MPISKVIRWTVAALATVMAVVSVPRVALAFSAATDLVSQQTHDLQQQKKLLLIDVRTEPEWRQTGIAKGAIPISMQDLEFLAKFRQLRSENPDKIIAFICASGRRSGLVQAALVKNGFKNVFSVFGGTTGSSQAPGWIVDGLPILSWPDGREVPRQSLVKN